MNKLEFLEPRIRAYARRFSSVQHEIEDLEQTARIAIWREVEKTPERDVRYLSKVALYSILKAKKAQRAKKRMPQGGIQSLNQQINDEDERTLEDVIGKEDSHIHSQEGSFEIIDLMRQRYGRFYINGIKNETRPKKIVRALIRGLLEEIEEIPLNRIPETANYKFFVDRGLQPLLWAFYNNSPFKAISESFEGQLLPWDFKRKPNKFWKGKIGYKNALKSLEWFCEKKGIKCVEDCCKVTIFHFEEEGLGGMLQKVFNSSPYLALKACFPDLKPWQARVTPSHYLESLDDCRAALNSFLLKKGLTPISELTPEETYEQGLRLVVARDSLEEFGLSGLLARYNRSPYKLFKTFFPNQILPWSIESKEVWKENPRETASEAVRWLFDNYLQIPKLEIPSYAACSLFWEVGFSGILTNRQIGFNSSPYLAVNNAYPGIYREDEFSKYRRIRKIKTPNLKKSKKGC